MLYAVRLHLGYGPSEWKKLSWWEQQMYVEELAFDGKLDTRDLRNEVGLDDLAASGISVERV